MRLGRFEVLAIRIWTIVLIGAVAPDIVAAAQQIGAAAQQIGTVATETGAAAPKTGAVAQDVGTEGASPARAQPTLAFEIGYVADFSYVSNGGLENKFALLGNLGLTADLSLEKLLGLKGSSLFVYGLGNHGDTLSEYVGDTQVTSNIEAPSTFKLYQVYFQQEFNPDFRLRLGFQDLNEDFAFTDSSGDFLNSSFGITKTLSQTGVQGPSIFPVTALAATAVYFNEAQGVYAKHGMFNAQAGDPDKPYGTHLTNEPSAGQLGIWELGYASTEGNGIRKIAGGIWGYTKELTTLQNEADKARNWGSYILFDAILVEDLAIFYRASWAENKVNNIAFSSEVGVVKNKLFVDSDSLGFGAAMARTGAAYQKISNSNPAETAIEVFYKFNLIDHVNLQPDIQYVINPGLDPNIKDALVETLRIEIQF